MWRNLVQILPIRWMEVSGVYNYSGSGNGIAVAGVANMSKGSYNGIQVSGVYNYSGSGNGIAVAGVANMSKGAYNGIQVSGVYNYLGSGNRGAYEYLPASVLRFPAPEVFMEMMKAAGFDIVEHTALTLGICRMYIGKKKQQ